ncbi:uncharacterized protein METZ01_LOCUS291882 [marine metagenome]|uniref:Uncharacterized protein n=1 Tax=marine metagenome TaxID=408172 RepID=A0A382LQP9_9ZZZZ
MLSLLEAGQEIVGRPTLAWHLVNDLSTPAYEKGTHGVIESGDVTILATDAKLVNKVVDHGLGSGSEGEVGLVYPVGGGIGLEDTRSIVLGIQGDGEELNVRHLVGEDEILKSTHAVGGGGAHVRH